MDALCPYPEVGHFACWMHLHGDTLYTNPFEYSFINCAIDYDVVIFLISHYVLLTVCWSGCSPSFSVFLLFTHTFKGLHANTHTHTHAHAQLPDNFTSFSSMQASKRGARQEGSWEFLQSSRKTLPEKVLLILVYQPETDATSDKEKRESLKRYINMFTHKIAAIICISLFIITAH